jgi:glycosyltransferase involved in cell wall biosynthesis
MRILLAQNMFHVPAHGGANKATRVLLETLAARGHTCHVVAPLTGALRAGGVDELIAYLRARGVSPVNADDTAVVYDLAGVRAHAVVRPSGLVGRIRSVASDLDPDWILVPAEDPARLALGAALATAPDRVVYLAYTIQQFPFGPQAFYPSELATAMLRRVTATVAPSRAAQQYLRRWGGIESHLVYPYAWDTEPGRWRPRPNAGRVTLVNPCAYKGIDIFLELARRMPEVAFLAVPTWGTTDTDRRRLAGCSNVEITEPSDDVGRLLNRTSVLLMPSLWVETFGITAIDAMLRGIPVLASDVGGLVEAKLGVPYSLPVSPIETYDARRDPARPVPSVPPQDVGPWLATLERLLSDRTHYDEVSLASHTAATAFIGGQDTGAVESYLLNLLDARSGAVGPYARRACGSPVA